MTKTPLQVQIRAVFFQVIGHFHGRRDRREHWQMPPPNYNGEQTLRDDCDGFAPHDEADPVFGAALRESVAAGVEAYAYSCRVTEEAITLCRELPLRL